MQTTPEERERCPWARPEAMWAYHDREWGTPVHDDRKHFEFLILEGAQAGLSWATILARREGYRRAFAGFDPERVARFTPKTVEKLLADTGIIRNRLKIESAISNARAFLELAGERGGFDAFIWGFVGGKPIVNRWTKAAQVPARTRESDALAAELKRRGFKFAGSTIMYAHMQACGLVDDHLLGCWRRAPRR